jgi:hypothetical protein
MSAYIIGSGIIDPVAMARVLASPFGGVMRDMQRRGSNVELGAKVDVGKVTRAAERSIVTRSHAPQLTVVVQGGGPVAPHFVHHHQGTRPHIIRPRRRKALRWVTPGGGVRFARVVHHPGTRPNPVLTANLYRAYR